MNSAARRSPFDPARRPSRRSEASVWTYVFVFDCGAALGAQIENAEIRNAEIRNAEMAENAENAENPEFNLPWGLCALCVPSVVVVMICCSVSSAARSAALRLPSRDSTARGTIDRPNRRTGSTSTRVFCRRPTAKHSRGRRAGPAVRPVNCSSRSGITRRQSKRCGTRRRRNRATNHDDDNRWNAESAETPGKIKLWILCILCVLCHLCVSDLRVSDLGVFDLRAERCPTVENEDVRPDARLRASRRTPRRIEWRASRGGVHRRRTDENWRAAGARTARLQSAVRVHGRN